MLPLTRQIAAMILFGLVIGPVLVSAAGCSGPAEPEPVIITPENQKQYLQPLPPDAPKPVPATSWNVDLQARLPRRG
jgi:hypothetical protein